MLQNWIGNLIQRQFEGRLGRSEIKTVTKQRVEAYYDMQLKAKFSDEIKEILPENLRGNKLKVILQHLNEAWRCYKANIDWTVEGMP